jgi:hypothetical protein
MVRAMWLKHSGLTPRRPDDQEMSKNRFFDASSRHDHDGYKPRLSREKVRIPPCCQTKQDLCDKTANYRLLVDSAFREYSIRSLLWS